MKKKVLIGILISLTTGAWCSTDPKDQVICIMNDIPILLKISSSAIAQKENNTYTLLPGKLSVSLLDRKKMIDADHMIMIAKPRNMKLFKRVQYSTWINRNPSFRQKMVPHQYTGNLVVEELKGGDTIRLIIRSNNNFYNEYHFIGVSAFPVVNGYRSSRIYDSITQSARQKQLRIQKDSAIEFLPVTTHKIEFQPGSLPEFKFNNEPLLKDSVIEYRIADQSIIGPWKKTGHLLVIRGLLPDNNYQLHLRYQGQKATTSYQFNIKPFWYQTVTTKMVASVTACVLIFLLIRSYYQNRLKKSMEERLRLEEQLKTIQSQLNPHFIFNALNSIEGLVTTGQTKLANDYLNNFSSIMRATLTNADKLLISLQQELSLLEKYIQIEQLRFGFGYHIYISPEISLTEVEVPPMLLQPLVENAVKHGLSENGNTKILQVEISRNHTDMVCTITNPLNTYRNTQRTAGGYGLSFTQQRLAHFKQLHPQTPILFNFDTNNKQATTQLIYKNWFS
jgi:hypothetical protein